jgi:tRNA nucleotidyltransferase/poly(A) polymerase
MENSALVRLFGMLDGLFVVGGAVRDCALGLAPKDVDFATSMRPDEIKSRLQAGGIRFDAKGEKFGNVVAIIGDERFEITTFRRDVYVRNRYPMVEFVDTPRQDSARRDFTMNALYVDAKGRVLDFVGGMVDIRSRIVRFIGPADVSCQRDPLRILRYFRFCGEYFHENFDPEALAACQENIMLTVSLPRHKAAEERSKFRASRGFRAVLKAAPSLEEFI